MPITRPFCFVLSFMFTYLQIVTSALAFSDNNDTVVLLHMDQSAVYNYSHANRTAVYDDDSFILDRNNDLILGFWDENDPNIGAGIHEPAITTGNSGYSASSGNEALTFDGQQGAFVPNVYSHGSKQQFAFELWIKPTQFIAGSQTIISVTDAWELRLEPSTDNSTARMMFIVYDSSLQAWIAYSGYGLIQNHWHFIQAVYEYNRTYVSIDGVPGGAIGVPSIVTYPYHPHVFLGSIWKFDRRMYVGFIDELRITSKNYLCGQWGYWSGDINKDCCVNLRDLAILGLNWL
ncbi:MAG: hypothetical protein A2Y10_19960 [Planctomycetes bacterium GWF2_41_51]|nr:MAG: hypothetical protein A2Y10_19960 [Planctomycetes bacterium GWF2_41_51]HBG28561.1 hypothetical protein [Phycisphaerales bacterium]